MVATRIAKPFLRWVGGKQHMLSALYAFFPAKFEDYYEPFLGGGSVFFELKTAGFVSGYSFLSDTNERLIRTYEGVRDDVERVICILRGLPRDQHFYYKFRDDGTKGFRDDEIAAWMIYINKVGFNGLYRENSGGGCNVPYGDRGDSEPDQLYDFDNLRACANLLIDNVTLTCASYKTVAEVTMPDDFLFCDPPYLPRKSGGFTSYGSDDFSLEDHGILAQMLALSAASGVKVMLTNSNTPLTRAIYDGLLLPHVKRMEVSTRFRVNNYNADNAAITDLVYYSHQKPI